MSQELRVYYFGPDADGGHKFLKPGFIQLTTEERNAIPVSLNEVEGGFCSERTPRGYDGYANMRRRGGWTILSFWDSSYNQIPGTCSTFMLEGGYCFGEVVAISQRLFPEVWNRLTFDLIFDGWRELKSPR